MSSICNGYGISGNLAEKAGRKYQVTDAGGKVLFTTTESIGKALNHAESLPAGDVQPPEEPVSEPEEVAEEKPAEPEPVAETEEKTKSTRSRKKK